MHFSAAHLRVEDVTLERGDRLLASGLAFSLQAGEALMVVGPNGAGKTTLLRAIAGLLSPARGRIVFESADGRSESVAACAHYVGHADALKPSLTALENVTFWAEMLAIGAGPGLTPLEALKRLGIGALADLPVAYLSAGQKRRTALARLLAARRPLWLLDEPTTALDAASQGVIEDMIADHLADGGIAVLSTHAPLGKISGARLSLGLS